MKPGRWLETFETAHLLVPLLAIGLLLLVAPAQVQAFSLLGPYADWMTKQIGYDQPGDIGGPMDIGQEYRWNVPVVTYAFDQSFLDYFGSNGVQAVEQAVQILNDLPPASQLSPDAYPLATITSSDQASAQGLFDLKSAALSLLVEQMGLAQPVRFALCLGYWDMTLPITHPLWLDREHVLWRTFDPLTREPTLVVNSVQHTGSLYAWTSDPVHYAIGVYPLDSAFANGLYLPVAERQLYYDRAGRYYGALTRDDVGGIAYLLSTNNTHYETLVPGIFGAGTNATGYVNAALRPGIDKLTFLKHLGDPVTGMPQSFTNFFTDTFLTNGIAVRQQLGRVISAPDILFCVADLAAIDPNMPPFTRTGTSNWINNAALNGGSTNMGPGIIRPPIRITFHKAGQMVLTKGMLSSKYLTDCTWGSFSNETNACVVYPTGTDADSEVLNVDFQLHDADTLQTRVLATCSWRPAVGAGGRATLQVSTNLVDWTSVFVVTNRGSVIVWWHDRTAEPQQFYRVLPF